jgi:hypothetical protein
MDPRNGRVRARDSLVLLLLLGLFLLLDPVRSWWASSLTHWLWPYFIWGGLVGLTWLSCRQWRRDRGGL